MPFLKSHASSNSGGMTKCPFLSIYPNLPPEHAAAAQRVKSLMAAYRRASDLITIGAYKEVSDPDVDTAIRLKPRIDAFLRQQIHESISVEESVKMLQGLTREGK